ncbi:MAG: restriction endonuclease [Synergistaceae bacterium]|jgi:DNA modification methylase|nr:restriction endonuclease [Synergistaceae bacterium]
MKNKIFYGDSLEVLRKYVPDESIDLCYIDPPFNSSRNYNQIYNNVGQEDFAQAQAFMDTWTWNDAANDGLVEIKETGSTIYTPQTVRLIRGLESVLGKGSMLAYIVSLTRRVTEIRRALKPTGSFYLHCDPTASHYLKLMLDGVFLPGGGEFLNEIVWKRTSSHNRAKRWGPIHDVIFFYSKSDRHTWNRVPQDYNKGYVKKFYRHEDERGFYASGDLTGQGRRSGSSGLPWKGIDPTEKGRHWALPSAEALPRWFECPDGYDDMSTCEKLDVLDKAGFIYWPSKGAMPTFKRYYDETKGSPAQDIITDINPLSAQAKEKLGYPTQKPEALLERIIRASSDEGDTVLDAYCGCGTTVAVAERLNRKWIGVDITYQSISLIIKRLQDSYGEDVMDKVELFGIPRDLESAAALAHKKDDRTRKEFEKWAVLTYSDNKAMINEKKGADGGLDGVAFIREADGSDKEILFSVKSGAVNPGMVRDLLGLVESRGAAFGVFITLAEPTPAMRQAAAAAGRYENTMTGQKTDRILIVTTQEILDGGRLHMPYSPDVVKSARPDKGKDAQKRLPL